MRRRATLPRSRTDINDPPESGIGWVGRQRERDRATRSRGAEGSVLTDRQVKSLRLSPSGHAIVLALCDGKQHTPQHLCAFSRTSIAGFSSQVSQIRKALLKIGGWIKCDRTTDGPLYSLGLTEDDDHDAPDAQDRSSSKKSQAAGRKRAQHHGQANASRGRPERKPEQPSVAESGPSNKTTWADVDRILSELGFAGSHDRPALTRDHGSGPAPRAIMYVLPWGGVVNISSLTSVDIGNNNDLVITLGKRGQFIRGYCQDVALERDKVIAAMRNLPDIFHFVNQPKIEEPDPRILGQVRKASTTQASDEQD